jgi:hypothetical protein
MGSKSSFASMRAALTPSPIQPAMLVCCDEPQVRGSKAANKTGGKCQRLSRHFRSNSWLYEVSRRIEMLASKRRDGFVFERESRMQLKINRKDK